MSDWENQKSKPDPDTIELICGTLDITPNYLLGIQHKEQAFITEAEQDYLNKYRFIDEKGKHTVNTVLEMEYNRCNSANLSRATKGRPEDDKSYLLPKAAHNDSITDLEELEKTKRDLAKLMKPEK